MTCPKCKSDQIESKVVDRISDSEPCEIAYVCGECGVQVDYWAYGLFESGRQPVEEAPVSDERRHRINSHFRKMG